MEIEVHKKLVEFIGKDISDACFKTDIERLTKSETPNSYFITV